MFRNLIELMVIYWLFDCLCSINYSCFFENGQFYKCRKTLWDFHCVSCVNGDEDSHQQIVSMI